MSDQSEPEDLHAAAAAWLFKLEAGLSAPDRRAFEAWISRSPAHAEVLARQAAIMNALFQTRLHPDPDPDPAPLPRARVRRVWLGLGSGAGVLALAAMVAVLLVQVPAAPGSGYEEAIVSVAEVGSRAAPDGSRIWIDARSNVQVAYTKDARSVHLLEGGVFVEVERNVDRPFGVRTDRFTAVAVGTAFEVQQRGPAARVRVSEGVVRLTDAGGSVLRELEAGNEAILSDAGVWTFGAVSPASVASWRNHRLIFADARLDEVAETINRYRETRHLRIDDAIASIRVSGVFSVDPEAADEPGQSLADSVGARLSTVGEDDLLIAP